MSRGNVVRSAWVVGWLLAAGVAFAPLWAGCSRGAQENAPPAGKATTWYCPMHPTYTSDKPGTCPICNMDLVPMEQDKTSDTTAGEPHASHDAATGAAPQATAPTHAAVHITPEKQQLIGVRLAAVASGPLHKTIRTVGKVEYDETRLHHVHTKVEGWIGKLYASATGQWVKAGEPLFTIYSPELVTTQQEYLLALQAAGGAAPAPAAAAAPVAEPASGPQGLVASVQRRLELWDIDPDQIAAIARDGQPRTYLDLVSHASGVIVEKAVLEGMRVMPGEELYKLADLSQVWVGVAIYEYELPLVKVGQPATLTLAYAPGDTLRGRIAYVYPYLDEASRTAQVRLEFANPRGTLKPGMFANVEIDVALGEGLSVPADAVLDSGERQLVFVAVGDGNFQPRAVQLGQRLDGRLEIRSGLQAGEQVVSGAQFLIDSESQLRAALQDMAGDGGHQH